MSISGSVPGPATSGHRPHTASPARGNAAATQEGESTSGSNTRGTTSGGSGSSHHAMVCMARAVRLEHAMSARRVVDYNQNPTLRRPTPQPIPTIRVDHEGEHFLAADRFVTLIFPLSPGSFNPILEEHIARQIAPAH
jgi:hypothetical protein